MIWTRTTKWKGMPSNWIRVKRTITRIIITVTRIRKRGLWASPEKSNFKMTAISSNFTLRASKATRNSVRTAWEQRSPIRTLSKSRWTQATRKCKRRETRLWNMTKSIWKIWVLLRRRMKLFIHIRKPFTKDIAIPNWPKISWERRMMTLLFH